MANLTINILTKYAEAEKGFTKISGTLTKYRNELLKANAEGKKGAELAEYWGHYKTALNNVLKYQHLTKDGMAELTAQSKTLARELVELDASFGSENENVKELNNNLDIVKKDMAEMERPAKAVTQNIKEIGKASDNTALKLLSVAKNILKFQILMAPITAVVRGFKNTISDSIKLAGEAEQAFNKLATVFDGFGDSAKRMASSLASSIGVANSTAASALSTVGDLLQAQGMGTGESLATASEWVRQFQDIIAFKDINMSLEEFAQNFMSGAAGNLRNFRTFGSIVKESAVNAELAKKGLDKLTGSELELAKMTTRAEMALRQQANAMGATEREWETALSVNRRLSEAWKAYKENLGDTINSVLKPMKQWWADILDQINKANKAQEEYNKNNKTPGVYDIHNNSKDMAAFTRAMNGIIQWNGGQTPLRSVTDVNALDSTQSMLFSQLKETFIEFEATVNDVRTLMGDDLSKAIYDYLEELDRLRTAEAKQRAEIEARQTNITTMVGNADSFMESLAAIAGVGTLNTQDLSWMTYKDYFARGANSEQDAARIISEYLNTGIEEALGNIKGAKLESFANVIDVALGETNEGDLLKTKAESFRQFYEVLHNYFGKDGDFSQEELDTLEGIKQAYQDANDAAEAYQKRIEAEAGIKGHIGNAQDVLLEASLRQRFTDEGKPSDQMSIWIKYEKELQELDKLFKTLGTDTIELNGETFTQAKAINLLKEARQAEIDAIKKEEKELGKIETFFKNLSDAGATNFASALQGSSLYHFYDAYNKASTSENGLLGETGAEAGITAILLEILAQTEVFQEILDVFSPIIQIMNAFLKPLEPILESISEAVSAIFTSILKPLFEPFKIMAAGVLLISKTVETIAKAVGGTASNVGTFAHNALYWLGGWAFGMERQSYYDYSDIAPIWNNIDQELASILNATLDIKENTDKDNSELLKAYTQMRDKGMITGAEWEALVNGLDGVSYDRMRTYGGNAWQNGKGGTTVIYYGDLKFTIDGTNLSAEEIAEAVTRKQKEWAGNGQYA